MSFPITFEGFFFKFHRFIDLLIGFGWQGRRTSRFAVVVRIVGRLLCIRTISSLPFYFDGSLVDSELHHSILSNYCRHLTVCMSAAVDKPFGLGTLILTNI